eukprot:gb/GECG01009579.1/.p1 GENE.gb/GECG01009579.1/~~gb/GECG01009579.1/.p1  ORF type:complete len:118 (+),score=7.40 gb/GECG01009579.1/:1-354(+)
MHRVDKNVEGSLYATIRASICARPLVHLAPKHAPADVCIATVNIHVARCALPVVKSVLGNALINDAQSFAMNYATGVLVNIDAKNGYRVVIGVAGFVVKHAPTFASNANEQSMYKKY